MLAQGRSGAPSEVADLGDLEVVRPGDVFGRRPVEFGVGGGGVEQQRQGQGVISVGSSWPWDCPKSVAMEIELSMSPDRVVSWSASSPRSWKDTVCRRGRGSPSSLNTQRQRTPPDPGIST